MSFGSEFPSWLEENAQNKLKFLPGFIITITDYMDTSKKIIDPALALTACIYKMQNMVSGGK